MSGAGTPPGWYPDPYDPRLVRWWDGQAWTAHLVSVVPAAPAVGAPHPASGWPTAPGQARSGSVQALQASEAGMARWAVAYTLAVPVVAVLGGLDLWAESSGFSHLYPWFRTALDNAGTPGYVVPPAPSLYDSGPARAAAVLGDLASLGVTVLFVLFLIWQYRATMTARALGYPAKRSPGWGVGSWFVPVVGLWMPFQAIRDCLAPGHPARGWLWRPGNFSPPSFPVGCRS